MKNFVFSILLFNSLAFMASEDMSLGMPIAEDVSVNLSPQAHIERLMNDGIISSPAANEAVRNLKRLVTSPGGTKEKVLSNLSLNLLEELSDSSLSSPSSFSSPEDKNRKVYESFSSPDRKRRRMVKVLEHAVDRLPDNRASEFSAVNMNHVVHPRMMGNKVIGGHWIENYAPGEVAPESFLGQDRKTLGIFTGYYFYPKTVRKLFDSTVVLNSLRSSRQVAMSDTLRVSRTSDGSFVGSYHDKDHPLKVNTLFPLLVVDPSKRNEKGNIVLGWLGALSSDYNTFHELMMVDLTPDEYNEMMRRGVPLATDPGSPIMADVTNYFKRRYGRSLRDYGFEGQFPGRLYGYGYAS